ncbi:MAG: hypothetical protein OXP71_00190 [Candidatus Poribacteria bacterium]|nr:hypothetical protein [Candidatus Poribacteria bacterium]
MKNKRHVFIIAAAGPLLAILGYLGLRWLTPSPPTTDTTEHTPQPQSHSRAKAHKKPPGSMQSRDVPWTELKNDDPWIVFYNNSMERVIEAYEEVAAKDGLSLSPEHLERLQAQLLASIDAKRTAGDVIPELSELLGFDINNIPTRTEYSSRGKLHEGPQTVEAIMESFEEMDRASPPEPDDDAVDRRYPRGEWIQHMLDNGVVFEDYGDYSGYLGIRRTLMAYEDNPNEDHVMLSKQEYYGLPPNAPWEEVAQAIIDKSHQNLQAMKQAELVDPLVAGGFGTRHGFIPARENTLYVKVDEKNFSANFYGDLDNLSDDDEEALVFDGIAPQGLDVVYLDEFDKPLPPDVKPRLDWSKYDWNAALHNMSDDDWTLMTEILNEIYEPDEQKHHGFEAPATDIIPDDYPVNPQIPSPDRDKPSPTSPPGKKLRGFETPTMKRRIAEVFKKHETEGTELPPALQSLKSEYEARKRRWQRATQMETKNSKIETDPAHAPPTDDEQK